MELHGARQQGMWCAVSYYRAAQSRAGLEYGQQDTPRGGYKRALRRVERSRMREQLAAELQSYEDPNEDRYE